MEHPALLDRLGLQAQMVPNRDNCDSPYGPSIPKYAISELGVRDGKIETRGQARGAQIC